MATNEVLTVDFSPFREASVTETNFDKSTDEQRPLLARNIACHLLNLVNQLCHRWHQDLPPLYKSSFDMETYSRAIKNRRKKMEDRHIAIHQFNALYDLKDSPSLSFFGVYDGHGGIDASSYTVVHLNTIMADCLCQTNNIREALIDGFEKTDKQFGDKSQQEHLHNGTTAVVAVVTKHKLYISWLGDSQVILSRGGKAVVLMDPHKPEREDEKARIEALGGCVVWYGAWRVNGTLSVSRAIGDADHKPYVSGTPDTNEIDLDGTEDFILLACDGLWDVLTPEETVDIITNYLNESDGKRENVPELIIDKAVDKGSSDNISVVVSFFPPKSTEIKEITSIEGDDVQLENQNLNDRNNDEDMDDKDNPSENKSKEGKNSSSTSKDRLEQHSNNNNKADGVNSKGSKDDRTISGSLKPIVMGYPLRSNARSSSSQDTPIDSSTASKSLSLKQYVLSNKSRSKSYTTSVLDTLSISAQNKTTIKAALQTTKGKPLTRKISDTDSNSKGLPKAYDSKIDRTPALHSAMELHHRSGSDSNINLRISVKGMTGSHTASATAATPRQSRVLLRPSVDINTLKTDQELETPRRFSMPSKLEGAMQVSKMETGSKSSTISQQRTGLKKIKSLKK